MNKLMQYNPYKLFSRKWCYNLIVTDIFANEEFKTIDIKNVLMVDIKFKIVIKKEFFNWDQINDICFFRIDIKCKNEMRKKRK